jgi:hypothetical protein
MAYSIFEKTEVEGMYCCCDMDAQPVFGIGKTRDDGSRVVVFDVFDMSDVFVGAVGFVSKTPPLWLLLIALPIKPPIVPEAMAIQAP